MKTLEAVKLFTFPARPVAGGDFTKAKPKRGNWIYEPKVNGWRVLVHRPTGTMFNRHGEQLSIQGEFWKVLGLLGTITNSPDLEWLDCEAFERRHPHGKGSLVLLDAPSVPGTLEERKQSLFSLITGGFAKSWAFEHFLPEENSLLMFAYSYETLQQQAAKNCKPDADMDPYGAWKRLQKINKALGCDMFEGLVGKREDSIYPVQLLSPETEFPYWTKYRWHW